MARIDTLNNFLTDVADSIREKKGSTDVIPAANFDTEIESIPSGGGVDINDYFIDAINDNNHTISAWLKKNPFVDSSSVTIANSMFDSCYSLTEVLLLDTSKVTTASRMFYNCVNLKNIPLLDTSKVTNMQFFVYGCRNLIDFPLLNTSAVTDMSYMFDGCSKITSIPTLDTSNVGNMDSCFWACSSLTNIPKLSFQSMTNLISAFYQCSKLTNLGGFENLGQAYSTTQSANYGKYRLDLSNTNLLTHDSLMNVINNLYDIATAGVPVQQFIIGATNLAKLTEEEIKIATDKGWTVS